MKLGEWRRSRKMTLAALGVRTGVGPETIRRHELPADHPKFRMPRREQLIRYYLASERLVTPNDFVDLPAAEAEAA